MKYTKSKTLKSLEILEDDPKSWKARAHFTDGSYYYTVDMSWLDVPEGVPVILDEWGNKWLKVLT